MVCSKENLQFQTSFNSIKQLTRKKNTKRINTSVTNKNLRPDLLYTVSCININQEKCIKEIKKKKFLFYLVGQVTWDQISIDQKVGSFDHFARIHQIELLLEKKEGQLRPQTAASIDLLNKSTKHTRRHAISSIQ